MTASSTDHALPTLIARLAYLLREAGPGLSADLRRLDPGAADRWKSAGFYRLYACEIAPERPGDDDRQRRWAMVLSGMARLPHRQGIRPGQALAKAGYAERRLARLLSADEDRLGDELRAAVAFLKAKQGQGVDWLALALLALTVPGSDAYDDCRRQIAENYFANLDSNRKG